MNAAILSIGDELLIGQVVNTNATWLGDRLTEAGVTVVSVTEIPDERNVIVSEIRRLAATADLLIVSGGLGPTEDDLTREAICEILRCDMALDDGQLRRIERRFAERGVELNERSRRQALVPSACRVIPNDYGSAAGLEFAIGHCRVVALPGVPSEMKGIVEDQVLPGLRTGAIEVRTFLVFGPPESKLADMLSEVNPLIGGEITRAFLPSPGGIRVRLLRTGGGPEVAQRFVDLQEGIRRLAGDFIVSDRDEPFAAALGRLLIARGLTLATAESCTGGMLGELVTEIAGSSAWYLGGVVSYADAAKISLLDIEADMIAAHGAVSQEVASAMAAGVRSRLGSDIGVGITGIAGPTGGSDAKPVGTVWIAVASARGVAARRYLLGAERAMVRTRAAYIAMDLVRRETIAIGNVPVSA